VFIPTRIVHGYERRPIVTSALIGLNMVVFVYWLIAGSDDFGGYWFDPDHLAPIQFFTAMFLHVGFPHLIGNMLFLWVYGIYVEDRLGHLRMLGVYLAFGVAGSLTYLATSPKNPARAALQPNPDFSRHELRGFRSLRWGGAQEAPREVEQS